MSVDVCRRSSTVEPLICNQMVGGSIPLVGSILFRWQRDAESQLRRMPSVAPKRWYFACRKERRRASQQVEGYPSGQRGQTVNLLAYAYGGSNPPPSTILRSEAYVTLMLPSYGWQAD